MRKRIQTSSFKIAFITIAIIGATSCSDKKNLEDTKYLAEEHKEAKFDNTPKERDSQFLVNAAEIDLEEIQLGKLAQQNSNLIDVKELGMLMETEHGKSLTNLNTLAVKKIITIPANLTDKAKKAYDKLNEKSGKEFDKDYCEMMVKGHKDAIFLFDKASTECSDSDIRAWALSTLPALRTHLDHAITCQEKCKKMK
jgi:putative membrane protein